MILEYIMAIKLFLSIVYRPAWLGIIVTPRIAWLIAKSIWLEDC